MSTRQDNRVFCKSLVVFTNQHIVIQKADIEVVTPYTRSAQPNTYPFLCIIST